MTHFEFDYINIEVVSGNIDLALNSSSKSIFHADVLDFISTLSREILSNSEARDFPDLISV